MNGTKKWIRGVAVPLLALLGMTIAAQAAYSGPTLGIVMGNDGDELVTACGGVILTDGEAAVIFSDPQVIDDQVSEIGYSLTTAAGIYPLVYEGTAENGLVYFTAGKSPEKDPAALRAAGSVAVGEELSVHYIGADKSEAAWPVVIAEKDGKYVFQYASDANSQGMSPFGVIVNEDGALVAIERLDESFTLFCEIKSGDGVFSGGSSGGSGGSPSGGSSGSSGGNSGSSGGKSNISTWVVVCAAAVALGLLAKKKGWLSRPKTADKAEQPPLYPEAVPPAPMQGETAHASPACEPSRPARSGMLYLCCEGGAMDGRRYPISTEELLIGRNPNCNICYPADTKGVSREHCKVFWKNGVLHIMDLGSTAGTFIRGKGQIPARVPQAVNAGDVFYLGEKRNAFVIRMG